MFYCRRFAIWHLGGTRPTSNLKCRILGIYIGENQLANCFFIVLNETSTAGVHFLWKKLCLEH